MSSPGTGTRMNSTTAEEALERAKAIAARLSGGGDFDIAVPAAASASAPDVTATTKTTTSTKRKRWGVAPTGTESAKTTTPTEVLPGLSDAAKKLKQGVVVEPMKRRIWVTTSAERPPSHFLSYLPDKFQEIVNKVAGKTSASDDKDGEKNKDSSMSITIKLKGRGSSRVPSLIGMPEEPMHILLSGPPSLVPEAEPLVDALLVDAEKAPVEQLEPLEALPPGSESNGDNNHLALTTTNSYRPATVAQLLANNAANLAGSDGLLEEQVGVPNGIVGYLIGRGGETISTLQAKTGCKIQIQKEHELQPGQIMRVITLQATTPASIAECRGMIETMVAERIRAAGGTPSSASGAGNNASGGGGAKDAKVGDAVAAGHALVQVQVPDADVGLIIGKSGSTIKSIQESTGASIQIPPSGNVDDPSVRTVSITHPNEQGALAAKQQIEDMLNSKPSYAGGGGGGGGNSGGGGQQLTIQIMIPDRDVGLCIGRQGCVIREMQHKTNTRIQIPSQPTPGQPHRTATVVGTQDGCNLVQGLIDRIINEQSSACVMSGTPYHNQQGGGQQGGGGQYHNGQQQQQQQAYGQPQQGQEYSAEWQAYYAAQALTQQAAAPAPAAVVAPAATGQGADAYYEQFFRYAYYYGEDAARAYYGAWSPAPGTPNPYGANPAGTTAAPGQQVAPAVAVAPSYSQAPAAAPVVVLQQQQQQQQQQPVRDSSVRKVSNLPAWMTRGN